MKLEKLVTDIVSLNGDKKLIGKTRLQKSFYLLDRLGMNSGVEFNYHHYGPYSADVASAAEMATLFYGFDATEKRSEARQVAYTTYSSKEDAPKALGDLAKKKAEAALASMAEVTDTVLELAATMVFLRENGHADSYKEEVRARKPLKATDDRLRSAEALVRKLGV